MLNNSLIFSGTPMSSEVFLNQLVETLGITIIDGYPKGRPLKMEKNYRKK